jgi:hypothetical protein
VVDDVWIGIAGGRDRGDHDGGIRSRPFALLLPLLLTTVIRRLPSLPTPLNLVIRAVAMIPNLALLTTSAQILPALMVDVPALLPALRVSPCFSRRSIASSS